MKVDVLKNLLPLIPRRVIVSINYQKASQNFLKYIYIICICKSFSLVVNHAGNSYRSVRYKFFERNIDIFHWQREQFEVIFHNQFQAYARKEKNID